MNLLSSCPIKGGQPGGAAREEGLVGELECSRRCIFDTGSLGRGDTDELPLRRRMRLFPSRQRFHVVLAEYMFKYRLCLCVSVRVSSF